MRSEFAEKGISLDVSGCSEAIEETTLVAPSCVGAALHAPLVLMTVPFHWSTALHLRPILLPDPSGPEPCGLKQTDGLVFQVYGQPLN